MKKIVFFAFLIFIQLNSFSKEYVVTSPSGNLTVSVNVTETVTYSVFLNGNEIIAPSPISMILDNGLELGKNARVKKVKRISVRNKIIPIVQRKYDKIEDYYNLLTLSFKNYTLSVRAYNEGMAYRWSVVSKTPFRVKSEQVTFSFPTDHITWFPEEESMFSHMERHYKKVKLSEITPDRFCSNAMLIDCGKNVKVYISESDLIDYPGMFLKGSSHNPNALVGKFAGVVLKEERINNSDREIKPVKYADYIAECTGSRTFPWRVAIISSEDADLVQSELIYKLASGNVLKNTDWISPGKVAWDWWNALNIYGVDFKSGINNKTYKYYIDFASKYGVKYIILDEGWYHLDNIMHVVDDIDIKELVDYGKKKNVGIILWVIWKALDDQLTEALDQFEKWGVKGIKIDYMKRNDQWMVSFYEKIARECASRHLLVDYHAAYKPSGLRRKYPNVMTREGVRGLEWAKWSKDYPNPEHNLTLPFTRMVAGPMDYTPGAMINVLKKNFKPQRPKPMSVGTRCHQLGMYVVFESPLQMLADNPSNYYREPECMEFISAVPTVWNDTKVLEAKVSDYILVARRSGEKWFVGAMTDWTPRTLDLDFSFLPEGKYKMQIWKDGINADKYAADFAQDEIEITSASKIKIKMASGGGWVAILSKE